MKYFQSKDQIIKTVVAIALCANVFSSCTTIEPDFGSDLIPDEDKMLISSKVLKGVKTYNVQTDSIPSDKWGYTYLGSMITPEFGGVDADFAATYVVRFSDSDSLWGDDAKIDSVVLNYSSFLITGDTINSTTTTIEVRELDKELPYEKYMDSSVYFTNFNIDPLLSNETLVTFDLDANEFSKKAHLPIAFAEKFIDTTGGIYMSDSLFLDKFYGLYFASEEVDSRGVMREVDLNNTNITVYYKNTNKPDTTYTAKMLFFLEVTTDQGTFSTVNQAFTMIDHRYDLADPFVGINPAVIGDTLNSQKKIYIEGVAGVMGLLDFPKTEIDALKAEAKDKGYLDIAINNATITFNVHNPSAVALNNSFSRLGMMNNIYAQIPVYHPNYGTFQYIVGDAITGYKPREDATSFGGTLNRSKNNYSMNITSYVQGLINYDEEDEDGTEVNYKIQLVADAKEDLMFKATVLDGGGINGSAEISLTYTFLK